MLHPVGGADVTAVEQEIGLAVAVKAHAGDQQRQGLAGMGVEGDHLVLYPAVALDGVDQGLPVGQVAPQAQRQGGLALGGGAGVAQQPAEAVIDHHVAAAVQVGQGDDVGRQGHHLAEQGLRPRQGLRRRPRVALVDEDRQHRRQAGVLGAQGQGPHRHGLPVGPVQGLVDGGQHIAQRQGFGLGQTLARQGQAGAWEVPVQQGLVNHLGRFCIAQQAGSGGIGLDDAALAVQQQRRGHAPEQVLVAALGVGQRAPGLHAADVLPHQPHLGLADQQTGGAQRAVQAPHQGRCQPAQQAVAIRRRERGRSHRRGGGCGLSGRR